MSLLLKTVALICVICGLVVVLGRAQTDKPDTFFSEWRPNFDTHGIRYVGNKSCVDCHAREAAELTTPMANALEIAPDCRILAARNRLTFKNGNYTYGLARQGTEITYTVSDGVKNIRTPILYCFGEGQVGQTYVFRYNDMLYETRISYFQKLNKLDFTIGHRPNVPASLEDALGRALGRDEPQQCFGCHSTGAVNGTELKLERLSAGVGCDASRLVHDKLHIPHPHSNARVLTPYR